MSETITDGNRQVSDKALMELKLRLDPFFKGRQEASGGSGWDFVTYPQSGAWGHLTFTGSDPHVASPIAAGLGIEQDATVEAEARTLSVRAAADDGNANALRTLTETVGDGDATGVYSVANATGDGGATAYRGTATTYGAEDADGIYVAAETLDVGDAHGGSFYAVTHDALADATAVVADATAVDGDATGMRVSAGSTDVGGSGDALGGQFWAVAAGSGTATALRCLDEAGIASLEVRGALTYCTLDGGSP